MDTHIKHWTEFERIQKGRQPAGVERYRRTVLMFIDWLRETGISATPVSINRQHIDAFMKWLFISAGNTKNSSRANKLSALRSYFKYLVYAGVILNDPTRGVPTPKFRRAMPMIFSTEDLRQIFSMPDVSRPMGLRDKALLFTIYAAALRVSEVCNLAFENVIDSGSGYLRLSITGKGNKNRVLTLRLRPAALLRQWMTYRIAQGAQPTDPVFPRLKGGAYEGLSEVSVNAVLKKYAGKVNIRKSKVFIHKLRATCCTNLYDEGIGIYELMYFMGHSDPKTTMAYIAVSDKALRKTALPDSRFKALEAHKEGDHIAE